MTAATGDKRATPRIQPFVVPCRVSCDGQTIAAYITDLSPRGARLTCDAEPPGVGKHVEIELRFRRVGERAHVAGEVKWVHPKSREGSFTLGIRFVSQSAEARDLLERKVAEFRDHAARLS